MPDTEPEKPQVLLVADVDLSRISGDVARIMAFATELGNNGLDVTMITPTPEKGDLMLSTAGIRTEYINVSIRNASLRNVLTRKLLLIRRARQLRTSSTVLLIEKETVGGYFALAGDHGYILDLHGFGSDEVKFQHLPFYIPKKLLERAQNYLERLAAQRAGKIICVSETHAFHCSAMWHIPRERFVIIPNGFFSSLADVVQQGSRKEIPGKVTFVGILARWAGVEKIIETARNLQDEKATFYIVGDGPARAELQQRAADYRLENVVFTGFVPLRRAYEIIAESQIVLLPFPDSLCTRVACPLKVVEYMAFGKAMVLDGVSDIAATLKEKNAALVSRAEDGGEFSGHVRHLLHDEALRRSLGDNARRLSGEFSWEAQGKKLGRVIRDTWQEQNRGNP